MKKYIFMLLLVLVSVGAAFAQDQQSRIEVTGTVTDEQHEPLIGVTVTVKDQVGLGAITNIDGVFKIKIPQYSNIVFSYIGMETQTVFVKTQKTVNVVMKASKENVLDEVAVTGTGVQKKITLTGAVTTVSASDLKTPTASLSNSFTGVVPGVFARQTTGQPGNNVSEFWIRGISTFGAGSSALVLVDGFERDLNDINTEDIETFTVLKDASATAIYGSRGANGVVLITTKHGKEGKININAKAEYTYSTRTKTPEYVDGVTYAQLLNEARVTRNQQAAYTDDELYVLKNQLDPDIFPNVDWMGMLLRKGAPTYRANVDFSGGGQLARYFVSASYVDEGGMYKTDKTLDKYDTNANYHRFNYRMNVDMNLTKTTLLKVGISGSLEKQNQPGFSSDDIWYSLTGYTPVATPVKYSNGRFGAFGNGNRTNPYVLITQTGYNETWNNTVQTTAALEQNLDFVTKGLKFYGRFGFDVYSNSGNKRSKWPEQWIVERLRDADGELLFTKKADAQTMQSNPWKNTQRKEFIEAQLDYDRSFGDHQVGAVLKYTQDDTSDDWINYRHQGLAGRLTYGWKYRYYADFNFGYNGSENFAKGHRFGFFPAYSVAWNIGEEPWIKKHAKWIDMLKLRYSYGKVGNDYMSINGSRVRFAFRPEFDNTSTWSGDGDDAKSMGTLTGYKFGDVGVDTYNYNGLTYSRMANVNVTWEVSKKHDVGVDLYLFGNKFNATVDYFNEKRTGIYMTRSYLPQSVGLNFLATSPSASNRYPSANVGAVKSSGFDGNLALNQKIGQVDFTFRGNFTYSKNEILEYDEQYSHYPYSRNAGFRVNQARGLIAIGLFKDYEDIRYSPDQSGLAGSVDIAPGDIKYRDVNGDGKIDDNDIVPIGSTTRPNFIYGYGLSAKWKGFDFNVLFQGTGKSTFFINGASVYPFQESFWGNILTDVVGNYWSLGKNEDIHAKYPRMSFGGNSNNYRASTYWLRDGSYLRLKNLEIGYTLPKKFVNQAHINNIRVYFMGTNLLTFSSFKLWDPELGSSNGRAYPLSRTYTLGMTVSL